MNLNKLFCVLLCLIFPSLCFGATYYIDYGATDDSANGTSTSTPWKRCPGMVDFAGSYSHSNGDKFVFKGGVTWPVGVFPLTVANSGGAGNPDIYTGGQLESSPWGTGYPVFDGECSGDCASGTAYAIEASSKSNITVNGIKFYHQGYDQRGVSFTNACSSIIVSYNWFETRGVNAVEFSPGSANTTGFYLHHNYYIDNGHALFAGVGSDGYTYDDIQVYNNIYQGLGSVVNVGANHPDGLQIQGPATLIFTNLKIHHNQFRGVMYQGGTAIINLQWIDGGEIYNNLITFENTSDAEATHLWQGAISLGYSDTQHSQNIKIYNNTISSDANYATNKGIKKCIIVSGNQGAVDIKNNILSNCEIGLSYEGVGEVIPTVLTADYNFYQQRSGGNAFTDWVGATQYNTFGAGSDICVNKGWECNGLSGDPKFTTIPTGAYLSGDFRLQSTSTAKDAGVDLGATYNTDVLAISRPQGPAWDIGAYEYVAPLGGAISISGPGTVTRAGSGTVTITP